MSGRVKTTVIKDHNLIEMFNQMIGGEGDPAITADKMARMKTSIRMVAKIVGDLANPAGPFARRFSEYAPWCAELTAWNRANVPLLECKKYSELKDENQIRQIIMLASELRPHAHHFETMSDRWITGMPGLSYIPFKFTSLDLKHIWANAACTPETRRYLLLTIKLLYGQTNDVYQLYTTPDIDVKAFSSAIVSSIERIQTLPKLSRCKGAFKKIADSVSMLENNFTDYYKDMVHNKNPNSIIESFVSDVSAKSAMTPDLMRQFNQIISFYKEQTAGRSKDPKVQKLMDSLSARMAGAEAARTVVAESKAESKDDGDGEII